MFWGSSRCPAWCGCVCWDIVSVNVGVFLPRHFADLNDGFTAFQTTHDLPFGTEPVVWIVQWLLSEEKRAKSPPTPKPVPSASVARVTPSVVAPAPATPAAAMAAPRSLPSPAVTPSSQTEWLQTALSNRPADGDPYWKGFVRTYVDAHAPDDIVGLLKTVHRMFDPAFLATADATERAAVDAAISGLQAALSSHYRAALRVCEPVPRTAAVPRPPQQPLPSTKKRVRGNTDEDGAIVLSPDTPLGPSTEAAVPTPVAPVPFGSGAGAAATSSGVGVDDDDDDDYGDRVGQGSMKRARPNGGSAPLARPSSSTFTPSASYAPSAPSAPLSGHMGSAEASLSQQNVAGCHAAVNSVKGALDQYEAVQQRSTSWNANYMVAQDGLADITSHLHSHLNALLACISQVREHIQQLTYVHSLP